MPTEKSLDTGTVLLNYAEGPPTGFPFVVLHGGSTCWRYWQDLIVALVPDWHLFAPDLRGHGRSGHVPGHYLLTDYVADIATFLDRVVGGPAMLFGHSLGGEIAVMVAALHPGLVHALIVGDAPLSRDAHGTERPVHRAQNTLWWELAASGRTVEEIAAALRDMRVEAPGVVAPKRAGDVFGEAAPWVNFQAENLYRLDPDVLAAVLDGPERMLVGYDPKELLPRITCPVLLLQADGAGGMRDDEVV
jgi:pimeloyl-ACP methyl ester carboxylesterase